MFKVKETNTLEINLKVKELIDKFKEECFLNNDDLIYLLDNICYETKTYLEKSADSVRKKHYKEFVYLRGLVEFSNYCARGCYYCGISKDNLEIPRYRMSIDEILNCIKEGYSIGFRTFVLQSGEDPHYTDDMICDMLETINKSYDDIRITLSIGEKSKESFKKYFDAGAHRYLLRHEAANIDLYDSVHPDNMSLLNRKQCLFDLKEIGYQTGCGFMVGLPNQTTADLAEDLMFLKELEPEMVGIGPFIPHSKTRFKDEVGGKLDEVLVMLSLTRLLLPQVLLPATTALGTLNKIGRELAIKSGANVVMPNLSPIHNKKDYQLYEDKICLEDTSEQCRNCMEMKMQFYGYKIDMQVGDHIKFEGGK